MMEKLKFVCITRVIDPKTRIHHLDAIDTNGQHWYAEMSPHLEDWLCYTTKWRKDHQQPLSLSMNKEKVKSTLELLIRTAEDVETNWDYGAYTTPRPALRHIISYANYVLEEMNR